MEEIDLYENRFFKYLLKSHPQLLKRAYEQNLIISVPTEYALQSKEFTRDFAFHHFLQPSKFKENAFTNLANKTIVQQGKFLSNQIGYKHGFAAEILKEENAHISIEVESEEISILIKIVYLSTSIDDSESHLVYLKQDPILKFHTSKEYQGYFQNVLIGSEKAWNIASEFAEVFNQSFQFLAESQSELQLENCCNQIQQVMKQVWDESLNSIDGLGEIMNEKKWQLLFGECVESVVIGPLYKKLMQAMYSFSSQKILKLQANKQLIKEKNLNFGYPEKIKGVIFTSLESQFQQIEEMPTPWEKCQLLIKILEQISFEVKMQKSGLIIGADEVLPILISLIINTPFKEIQVNIDFVAKLNKNSLSSSSEYQLLNFQSVFNIINDIADDYQKKNHQVVNENKKQNLKSMIAQQKEEQKKKILLSSSSSSEDEEDFGAFGKPNY